MVARHGVQFGISIALARLLSPEEFGMIAILYLFTGIASTFIDSGFSSALIQRQNNTHTDESTVFWFGLGMGAVAAVILSALGPWIGDLFGHPILSSLTQVLALTLVINAAGSLHLTLLTKKLDFRTPLKIGVTSMVVSGALAISLALAGFGVWALALQALSGSVVTTALLWIMSRWRPRWEFSIASARQLFGFGGYLLLSALLDVAYTRVHTLIIGKLYGLRDLGFYSRADNTKQIPVGMLSAILSRVALPIFSEAAGDPRALRRGVQVSLRGIMLVNIPTMVGLLATAENTVSVLFGDNWLPAVPVLRVLCLAGVFWPLHVINLNVLTAQGHSHLFFRLEIVKKIVGTALLLAGIPFGVMGIAWSQAAFGLLGFLINAFYTGRLLNYGALSQLRDILPTVAVSAAMGGAAYSVGLFVELPPPVVLGLQTVTGVAILAALSVGLRLKAYQDSASFLLKRKAP